MKVLAIKQPWASLIAEGKKTIEVRSRPTNIRERVAIYATRTMYDENGFGIGTRPLPRGYIIATAEIVGCIQYQPGLDFMEDQDAHMIPCKSIYEHVGDYAWKLENVKRIETPIKYKMPKGCVVWANAELNL